MNEFIVRLQHERKELNNKLTKLNDFIKSEGFTKIDDVQQALLIAQSKAMDSYLTILDERLKRLA